MKERVGGVVLVVTDDDRLGIEKRVISAMADVQVGRCLFVLWEVSKDKYIKPKIKINTIELGGVEITYATAFNAKFVIDNCIGPGAQIQIVRSGDVIPKIEKVLKPSETGKPKLPSIKYPNFPLDT